jgi:hypothetical protein
MDVVEYQRSLASLNRLRPAGLSSAVTAVTFLLGPRRICQVLARKANALADQLARIDPPPDVAAEHTALIRAIRVTASELNELARRNDLRAFQRFEAMAEVNFAEPELRALEARGYSLPK